MRGNFFSGIEDEVGYEKKGKKRKKRRAGSGIPSGNCFIIIDRTTGRWLRLPLQLSAVLFVWVCQREAQRRRRRDPAVGGPVAGYVPYVLFSHLRRAGPSLKKAGHCQ